MQNEIGAYDAKTKLPEILRRVESGEAFTITNRGKPIADLTPSRSGGRMKTENAIRNILTAQKLTVSDEALQDLKNTGRK
jgi:prevent-host-death family protein